MKVKCISCGHELNLDHVLFDNYSGPVKCFSCSAMMVLKTTKGKVYSVNLSPSSGATGNRAVLAKREFREARYPMPT
jgi:ribosomal protein S27E